MRYIFFLFNLICIYGCVSGSSENKIILKDSDINETTSTICEHNYDSLLIKFANGFTPTAIDLNASLSSDLKSFLLSVDTNCLRKQTEYKYFIALILEKLALHHLKCCNQYYDLYQMREGAAAVIIREFNRLAGYYENRLEMLNSGLITDYIESDKNLSVNPGINTVMKSIKSEGERIKKGI